MMYSSNVRYVDHTYRDYSRYLDGGGEVPKHKKCRANFPAKLHKMVSSESNSHAITWMPHGRSFKVLDKNVLSSTVIPQYYGFKNYESFSRQLNAWGFKRLYQAGPDNGCYYNEYFLRGIPELTPMIRRCVNQGKSAPYPAGEPNFFRIAEQYPLPPLAPTTKTSAKNDQAEEVATAAPAGSILDESQSQRESTLSIEPSAPQKSTAPALAAKTVGERDHPLDLPARNSTAGSVSAATSYAPYHPYSHAHPSSGTASYSYNAPYHPESHQAHPPPPSIASMRSLTDYSGRPPYHYSYPVPQSTHDNHYHQPPPEYRTHPNAPYQTDYPPANINHYGQHYGSQYGHPQQYHPSRNPPQYEGQMHQQHPPYQYHQPYDHHQQYYHYNPPANVAPFKTAVPQFTSSPHEYNIANYSSRATTSDVTQFEPPPSDSHARNEKSSRSPPQSPSRKKDDEDGDVFEPLPYSPRPKKAAKEDVSSAPPVDETN